MEHLVTFKTVEGRDGNHIAPSLEEALAFVERLHNREEASEVRMFRMQEVPIEFKTYIKVEVGGGSSSSEKAEVAGEGAVEGPQKSEASADTTADDEAAAEASRRLFHRG